MEITFFDSSDKCDALIEESEKIIEEDIILKIKEAIKKTKVSYFLFINQFFLKEIFSSFRNLYNIKKKLENELSPIKRQNQSLNISPLNFEVLICFAF